VALCQGLGIDEITTNRPAQVLAQLTAGSQPVS
jgi:glycerophosphoryl diester phosphodiesterase